CPPGGIAAAGIDYW
nr:immunoglobulin heavy chain junction region [Macaca mulatta]